jgi:group I intron endonuclease
MKISGIYKIQSQIKPDRIYIGSAIDINDRWRCHLKDLRKKKHSNIKLQNHFNRYGETDFQFSILLGCNKEDLIKIEQYFIDSYNPYFNICKIAGNCLGVKRSDETKQKQRLRKLGYKMSDGTKLKIRLKSMGNKNSKDKKRGKQSLETRMKIKAGVLKNGVIPPSRKGIKMSEEAKRKANITRMLNKNIA